MLGGPFNYRWLYYSDLFSTADGSHAMFASLKWSLDPDRDLAMCAAMLALAFGLRKLGPFVAEYVTRANAVRGELFRCLGFTCSSRTGFSRRNTGIRTSSRIPITAFMASFVSSYDAPELMTMKTKASADDVKATIDRRGIVSRDRLRTSITKHGVKNVLVFVMESVPAEYLEIYGGQYPVTPTLKKYRDRSIIFKDMYAHAPATNMSLVSIPAQRIRGCRT